jgi:heptosyltransferase III
MKKIDLSNKRVLISRTDSIGDVILTLPLCSWIKENYPNATLIFLGKSYTLPILKNYKSVDEIVNWSEFESLPTVNKIAKFREINADVILHVFPDKEIASLAKKVGIPYRVGTSHRAYHLLTCNYRVNFTRKNSDKHEAQLNFELLSPFGYKHTPSIETLIESTKNYTIAPIELPAKVVEFTQKYPNYVILHPKSQGSALEWPIEKYVELAKRLNKLNYAVAFSGTDGEGSKFRGFLPNGEQILDTTGLFSLEQFAAFIQQSKGLVACSTGPLHIAATLEVKAIGLYSNRKPIHPGRWHAIGKNAHYLVFDEKCEKCAKGKVCHCIENISVDTVIEQLIH